MTKALFKIGFEKYADAFAKNMVDGDLLLLITEEDLKRDIQISSGLLRKRFMRELESLKVGYYSVSFFFFKFFLSFKENCHWSFG